MSINSGSTNVRVIACAIVISIIAIAINAYGTETGWYTTYVGLALNIVSSVAIFSCLAWHFNKSINNINKERVKEIVKRTETEKEVRKHQQTFLNFGLQLEKTVTERTRELKESRNILEKAQTVGHMGHWVYDIACTGKVMWSDELHRIFGTDKKDFDGSPEAFYSRIHPADFDVVSGEIANAAFKRNELEIQFRIVRADGVTRWVDLMLEVMRGNHDEPLQLIGVVRDITSSKEAEMERANMLADLVQRNKDLEQFAYIVSHNLRAPAANIVGLADALQKTTLPDALRVTFTKDISASAVKLDSIILDLNQILKVRGQVNEAREVIHFSELVHEVNTSINEMMRMENAWIKTDFSDVDEMPAIKSYMQSIFYNLITNSIKYRKPNERPILEIKSRRSGEKRIVLTFKDNGIGIDLKKKGDQVFGLYKRFHTGKEGTGLGLFMVKTQVETLGGKISIESTPMVGTEFSIEFDFANYANAA
jgi:PAS domain S-box-containing protein